MSAKPSRLKLIEGAFALDAAWDTASEVVRVLRPACQRIEIAGSLRREKSRVHDIDLVTLPTYHDLVAPTLFGEPGVIMSGPDALVQAIRKLAPEFPEPKIDAMLLRFTCDGIPVDIYLTEHDGNNFEALFQLRTGSAGFNAFLAQRARRDGLYYRAGYGIYESDKPGAQRIDDGSEAGIFAALGLTYTPPEKR